MRRRPVHLLVVSAVAVGLLAATTSLAAAAPSHAWTRQFGSASWDETFGVAAIPAGGVVAVGYTGDSITGLPSVGGADAFVRKYRPNGSIAWTRQYGSTSDDYAGAVDIAPNGAILVAGHTYGSLGSPSRGASDSYVRKYRSDGSVAWTRQFGGTSSDFAMDLAVDGGGNAIVAGYTDRPAGSLVPGGGFDAYVRKYRPDGSLAWSRVFGAEGTDAALAVAVDAAGTIAVGGSTSGSITGRPVLGERDAFVRVYRANGTVRWTRQFGSAAGDDAEAVAIDSNGAIIVAGQTHGSLAGGQPLGQSDAFVRKLSAKGRHLWTRQLGTAGDDWIGSMVLDADRRIYIAGTVGLAADAFVRKLLPGGGTAWLRRFGTAADDNANGLGIDRLRNVYVGGTTLGTLPGQVHHGLGDAFVRKYRR